MESHTPERLDSAIGLCLQTRAILDVVSGFGLGRDVPRRYIELHRRLHDAYRPAVGGLPDPPREHRCDGYSDRRLCTRDPFDLPAAGLAGFPAIVREWKRTPVVLQRFSLGGVYSCRHDLRISADRGETMHRRTGVL